ncbi:MAG: metallophosphoesterase [Planctomycetales bacterium]|nr:metallophosphoesterase [Planctomycetales bacterium]
MRHTAPSSHCLSLYGLILLLTLLTAGLPLPSWAHEGEEPAVDATSAPAFPAAVMLPNIDGPKPWSDKPVLNDPERFQIAIMTDRTGGHRPGIWMKAVERVNLLRPEFVVSVGDLIEGYTEDRHRINNEWEEFLGFIDKMQMRFFFVAGNHDLTNPTMHEIWRERFGPEWYSFDYKNVHFICLNSEDPTSKLGDTQLAWLREDLDQHTGARWTLIFLHKPLWAYADRERAAGNADPTGWTQLEKMLGDRPHTMFAGHHHAYIQFDRGHTKYYQLATTGGSSQLRGKDYGEFDHVMWLTMESDGPHIANLFLDGIHGPDVVTESSIARFRNFLRDVRVEVAPILVDDEQGFSQGQLDVRMINGFEVPTRMTGRFDGLPLRELTLEPGHVTMDAAAGKTVETSVKLQFSQKMSFPHLARTVFTANIATQGDAAPYKYEQVVPVVIDRAHVVAWADEAPAIDGDLSDWPSLRFATTENPLVTDKVEQWQGAGDGSWQFDIQQDNDAIYVAATVTDDRVIDKEDELELRWDFRKPGQRQADGQLLDGTYRLILSAPDESSTTADVRLLNRRNRPVRDLGEGEEVQASARRVDQGYVIECRLPRTLLEREQGDSWQSFQMAGAMQDVDEPGQGSSRIHWRGTPQFNERNTNYAFFVPSR